VDLLDWYRGRLSSRRLWVLIRHLPRESSFVRQFRGEEAEWDLGDHLLAAAVDHLAVANWLFATVNRDEDAEEVPFPEPLRRPGAVEASHDDRDDAPEARPARDRGARGASAAEIAAFVAAG